MIFVEVLYTDDFGDNEDEFDALKDNLKSVLEFLKDPIDVEYRNRGLDDSPLAECLVKIYLPRWNQVKHASSNITRITNGLKHVGVDQAMVVLIARDMIISTQSGNIVNRAIPVH